VKLLLDENLSRRLIPFLQHAFPGTDHVVHQGLESASDREVWDRARREGFVIVTRDADFGEMSLLLDQRAVTEQALVDDGAAVVELWA
jgi:predicted nuclease of predicted toxin-antitoxin system